MVVIDIQIKENVISYSIVFEKRIVISVLYVKVLIIAYWNKKGEVMEQDWDHWGIVKNKVDNVENVSGIIGILSIEISSQTSSVFYYFVCNNLTDEVMKVSICSYFFDHFVYYFNYHFEGNDDSISLFVNLWLNRMTEIMINVVDV